MAWTKIEEIVLPSSQASVTLGTGGTIPQTYKTLKLVVSARTDRSAISDLLAVYPNGSSANGTGRYLTGVGSGTPGSGTFTTIRGIVATGASATSSTFGNGEMTFPNYTSTTTNKPISDDSVSENNATAAEQWLIASLWSSTAAITSLQVLSLNSANLLANSTFTLYGLE